MKLSLARSSCALALLLQQVPSGCSRTSRSTFTGTLTEA